MNKKDIVLTQFQPLELASLSSSNAKTTDCKNYNPYAKEGMVVSENKKGTQEALYDPAFLKILDQVSNIYSEDKSL